MFKVGVRGNCETMRIADFQPDERGRWGNNIRGGGGSSSTWYRQWIGKTTTVWSSDGIFGSRGIFGDGWENS